ncbi:CoA ester lyase [Pyruvatibacter sp.]|uniref:HpcH/HpaI aldolase/citrate lyase family protein n=1 Tax=Pyruvatibacter sp. TaxID=1981328 RepID=UPI0032EF6F35
MLPQFDAGRPRRSVLYMPGANARALEKARTLDADTLIFDLEDAVAPDAKELARSQVVQAVRAGGYGAREVIVRVNGLDTPWGADDLAAIKGVGADGVLIPKVNGPGDIDAAASALKDEPIWAMMETPAAMFAAQEIAQHPLLCVLVMGTNDLVKELKAARVPGRAPLVTALQMSLLAARGAACIAIDGVYNDIKNAAGFIEECEQGRDFGFDGKTLIHPSQIAPCNEVFAPSTEAVEEARAILAAFDAPDAKGKGVITVGGKMVELLHAEEARRLVSVADAIAAKEAAA